MAKGLKYRLLKDLPDLPKGAVFKARNLMGFTCRRKDPNWWYAFSPEAMENKEWFERYEGSD